jgi:hypothetical protein
MKKSELKEMIKAAFLSEMDMTNAQDDDAALGRFYDPTVDEDLESSDVESAITGKELDLKKLEDATKKAMSGNSTDLTMYLAGIFETEDVYEEDLDEMLARLSEEEIINEQEEEEEEVDIDVKDTDLSSDDEEVESSNDSIVVDKKIVSLSSLPKQTRKILDTLETLRAQAEEFGDQKFITQVGNTITFFTRDFVVAGDQPNPAGIEESLEILKIRKLAGLLTEGEYTKALLRENEYADWTEADCMTLPPEQQQYCIDYLSQRRYMEAKETEEVNKIDENTIPSVVDILKDPKLGLKHFAKLDAYDTKFKLKDDSEALKKNPQLKGKEVEITGYYDPRENLLTIRSGNASVNVYPEEVEIIASTYTDNKEDYFKKNPKG